jgi:hypothetical protein
MTLLSPNVNSTINIRVYTLRFIVSIINSSIGIIMNFRVYFLVLLGNIKFS